MSVSCDVGPRCLEKRLAGSDDGGREDSQGHGNTARSG